MELTKEIKQQIRQLAEDKLKDGKDVVVTKQEIDDYAKVLETLYKMNELVLE